MMGKMPVKTPIKIHVVIQAPGERKGFRSWAIEPDFNPTQWLDDPIARGGYSVFAAQPLPGFLWEPGADVRRVALMIAYKALNGSIYYHRLPAESYQTIRTGPPEEIRKVLEGLQARFEQPLAHEVFYPHMFGDDEHGEAMAGANDKGPNLGLFRDDSILKVAGESYFPLPLAAWAARASEASISKWAKQRTRFEGQAIKVHVSSRSKALYVAESSVQRMANRFIKWPSGEPAGYVTLGDTNAQSGFIPMSEAAITLGVSKRTAWLWASQGKAPTAKPLDVIQCKTSGYFYIRERDVFTLKRSLPHGKLQRGRRPRGEPQP